MGVKAKQKCTHAHARTRTVRTHAHARTHTRFVANMWQLRLSLARARVRSLSLFRRRSTRSLLALGLIDTVNPMLVYVGADNEDAQLLQHLGLKLLLEHTKGEESYFAPYIKSLPSHATMPFLAYSTPKDLTELQFADIQSKAAGRMAQLDLLSHECERIRGGKEDPFKGVEISQAQLIWAICSVSSRVYRVRGKGFLCLYSRSLLPL